MVWGVAGEVKQEEQEKDNCRAGNQGGHRVPFILKGLYNPGSGNTPIELVLQQPL